MHQVSEAQIKQISALSAGGKGPSSIAVVMGVPRRVVIEVLARQGALQTGSVLIAHTGRSREDGAWQTRGFWRPG